MPSSFQRNARERAWSWGSTPTPRRRGHSPRGPCPTRARSDTGPPLPVGLLVAHVFEAEFFGRALLLSCAIGWGLARYAAVYT
jgi:hypothetical protein